MLDGSAPPLDAPPPGRSPARGGTHYSGSTAIVITREGGAASRPRPQLAGCFALDHAHRHMSVLTGGPDGVRLREFYTSAHPRLLVKRPLLHCFPTYFPLTIVPHAVQTSADNRAVSVDPAIWPQISARSRHGESLRALATAFGVSHETIRRILRHVPACRVSRKPAELDMHLIGRRPGCVANAPPRMKSGRVCAGRVD